MAHQTHSHSRRQHYQRGQINPNYVILGSILLIIIAIVAMVILSQDDDDGAKIIVVPEEQWMPGGDDFTPEFTLAGLEEGSQVSLSDFRGKYVMLNFWATWCTPCKAEMPDLQAYYDAHKDQNFVLIGVNVAEDAAVAQAFLDENGFNFPVVLDRDAELHGRYGQPSNRSVPISFLIDPDGKLIKAWRPGAVKPAVLESDVTPLLKG